MVTFSKVVADEEIRLQDKDKELKYEYQTNESMLISKLKDLLILSLLVEDDKKRAKILDKILEDTAMNRTSIKPNRHFERNHSPRGPIKRLRKNSL